MNPVAAILALMASPTEIQVSALLKSMTPSRPDQQRRRGHRTARLRGTGPCRHDGPSGACAGPQHSSWAKPCGRQAGILALMALFMASPAFSATILAIETSDCGVIHTRHETHDGAPVLMTERGSRKYVCGPYPVNPFAGDLYAKIPPELFGNEYPAPLATVASATVLDLPRRRHGSWQAGGTSIPSPLGVPPFTVTVHEPPRAPETPVETPTPVPAPASLPMTLAALAGLYGLWRMKR